MFLRTVDSYLLVLAAIHDSIVFFIITTQFGWYPNIHTLVHRKKVSKFIGK